MASTMDAAMSPKKNILIPLADGTDIAQLAIVASTLGRFQNANVVLASMDCYNLNCNTHGKLLIKTSHTLNDVKDRCDWDMIVLVGGYVGAIAFSKCQPLMDKLRQQVQAGKMYAAMGESPAYVLAQVPGALQAGHTCVPCKDHKDRMQGWVDADVVTQDNRVVTAMGTGTAFAFALEVGRLLFGPHAAGDIADTMRVDRSSSLGIRYTPERPELERHAEDSRKHRQRVEALEKQRHAAERASAVDHFHRRVAQKNRAFYQARAKQQREALSSYGAKKRMRAPMMGEASKRHRVIKRMPSILSQTVMQATVWATLQYLGWTKKGKKFFIPPAGYAEDTPSIANLIELLHHARTDHKLQSNKMVVHALKWFDACMAIKPEKSSSSKKSWFFNVVAQDSPELLPRPDSQEFFAMRDEVNSADDGKELAEPAIEACSSPPMEAASHNVPQDVSFTSMSKQSVEELTSPLSPEIGIAAAAYPGPSPKAPPQGGLPDVILQGVAPPKEEPAGVIPEGITDDHLFFGLIWPLLEKMGWTKQRDSLSWTFQRPPNSRKKTRTSIIGVGEVFKAMSHDSQFKRNKKLQEELEVYHACRSILREGKHEVPKVNGMHWLIDRARETLRKEKGGPS